jgi:hypothetical protein
MLATIYSQEDSWYSFLMARIFGFESLVAMFHPHSLDEGNNILGESVCDMKTEAVSPSRMFVSIY